MDPVKDPATDFPLNSNLLSGVDLPTVLAIRELNTRSSPVIGSGEGASAIALNEDLILRIGHRDDVTRVSESDLKSIQIIQLSKRVVSDM